MAHFAEIDEDNLVTRILVTDNDAPNEGYDWLTENLGGTWIKTSFNTFGGQHLLGGVPLRKNRAEIGFTYDAVRDAFVPPKPYDSWVLNEETCLWQAPKARPTDGKKYLWDEGLLDWVEQPDN